MQKRLKDDELIWSKYCKVVTVPPMLNSWKWERRAKLQQVDCGGVRGFSLSLIKKKIIEMNCIYYFNDVKKLRVVDIFVSRR